MLSDASGGGSEEAGRVALHELKHSLAHKSEGRFGIEVDPRTHKITGAFYEYDDRDMSDAEIERIITAPGHDMSEADKRHYEELRVARAKKRNWLSKLLGL